MLMVLIRDAAYVERVEARIGTSHEQKRYGF
jgi:hypothetical protein